MKVPNSDLVYDKAQFQNGDKRQQDFLEKFPENLEIVEFLKSQPFKFKEEN